MKTKIICTYINRNGESCQAKPKKGSAYCSFHTQIVAMTDISNIPNRLHEEGVERFIWTTATGYILQFAEGWFKNLLQHKPIKQAQEPQPQSIENFDWACSVLQVKKTDEIDDIKKKRNGLLEMLHPDKVSPKLRSLAEEQTQRINKAFDIIKTNK